MNNVRGCTQVAINVFGGIDQSLAPSDLPQGLSAGNLNCAFQPGSVFTRPPLKRSTTLPGTAQIVYAYSFTKPDGTNVLLQFTADGKMWANGSQIGQTAAGNKFKCSTMFDKAFIAISDGEHGADVPLQFDGTNLDRVSQDGPGANATYTASEIVGDTYPIATITQPPAQGGHGPWGFAYFLQSDGPGSTAAGNIVTAYYADSSLSGPDMDLVNAFNSGFPVYLYASFTGAPQTLGPWTVRVTSIGDAQPPGQPRSFYYFTFELPTVAAIYYAGSGHASYDWNYQRTLATLTTTVPVPSLEVGDVATLAGDSVSAYDGDQTITQTPTSAQLNITQTSRTAGIATYHYTVATGTPPTAGQLVTITGTLNANGSLNGSNLTIASASGGTTGTFTIAIPGADFGAASESGQGLTAGTVFCFDPGIAAQGTTVNPIYGNSTGGTLTFGGSAAVVSPGQRQAVVFFILRSGYTTVPSPIATFTVPSNTNAIAVTNLPIGPSNVIARAVAFTGANGGKFFYLPVAPQVSGVVSGTSTVVNDNTTTSTTFYFSDDSLLDGVAIDIPGNNLFRQVVLSGVLGMFPYAGRLFTWGETNKVQDFWNMGFEGGVLAGSPNAPLGWNLTGTGTLGPGDYGLAWTPNAGASLSQTAYTNEDGALILNGGTQYAFRCWVNGSATATLSSASQGFSISATVTASGNFGQADFSGLTPQIIPSDLVLTITGPGTMDELEIIYSANPYLQTARASYIDNPEAFDGVTGLIGPANDPHAIRSMYLRRDVLHMLTYGPEGSLYGTQDTASGEPNTWQINQIAAKCGALSVWGDAQFEDWQIWASDTGLRIYDGGSVEKMSGELQAWWSTLNRDAWKYFVVANDPDTRRVYLGGATGTSSTLNDCWVMDYRELNTSGAMANSTPLKVGFSGKMLTTDLTRKWSPWSLTFNSAGVLNGTMNFCGGGSLTSAVCYTLDEGNLSGVDADYGAFDSYYLPYYMLTGDEAEQLHLSPNRKLFTFLTMNVSGIGKVQVTPLVNGIAGRTTRAISLNSDPGFDLQFPINATGDRASFKVEAVSGGFWLSGMTVAMKDDPYAVVRGWNG